MMRGLWAAGAAIALVLAGCTGKPSAVAGAGGGSGGGTAVATNGGGSVARSPDPRDAPAPMFQGKPMWAANRRHTAEENALYQFGRNGGDFGAKSEAEYVSDAHHFVDHPPRGIETMARPNGDRLIYDPKSNVFAVVTRDGAPRTLFKPHDGEAYWTQQKEREARRAKGGAAGQGSDSSEQS